MKTSKFRRLLVLVFFAASLFFQGSFLSADRCESAFYKCLKDPLIQLFVGGPVFCAQGYLFCLKYLAN
jgi:hypothetical protein